MLYRSVDGKRYCPLLHCACMCMCTARAPHVHGMRIAPHKHRMCTARCMRSAACARTLHVHAHCRYDRLLYDELPRQGHTLLYTGMLRSAGAAVWGEALACAADRSGGGVLVHCAKGKDRTGVLCALLQHAVGAAASNASVV